jgi:hypothetical protein
MRLPFSQGVSYRLILVGCLGAAGLMAASAQAQEAVPAETPSAPPGSEPATGPHLRPPRRNRPWRCLPRPWPPPAAAMSAPVSEAPLKKETVPIKTVFGLRTSGRIQGASDPKKLNDISLDTLYLEARFSGAVDKYFGWQANFNGNAKPAGSSGPASIMDMILKVDVDDAFHVWAGRLLVPSDRSNFSGPSS